MMILQGFERSKKQCAARIAKLNIQFMSMVIHQPANRTIAQSLPPVTVNVILATETDSPLGVELPLESIHPLALLDLWDR